MHLETYVTDIIEGRRHGGFIKGLLSALSHCFQAGVHLRNTSFDKGWVKVQKVDAPVVSVGNIIAGGSGKTALIQKLCQDLQSQKKVAVVTRGFRSKVEKSGACLRLERERHLDPSICGDEAALLFQNLSDIDIIVGTDRVEAAHSAAASGAKLILLDDGMQYRKLHRDLEIVMLHAGDLLGKGKFLPRGYLRDSPSRLAEADVAFIHHVQDKKHFEEIASQVQTMTGAMLIGTRMVPQKITLLNGAEVMSLKGKRVGVFCGLGKPASFVATVKSMGAEVCDQWILPDHVAPTEKALAAYAKKGQTLGWDYLICSEKDGVKLTQELKCDLPIGILNAKLEIVSGQSAYESLLKRMAAMMESKRG